MKTEREIILDAIKRVYGEPLPPESRYGHEKDELVFGAERGFKPREGVRESDIFVFDGYSFFYTNFEFDEEGQLVRCSAWE